MAKDAGTVSNKDDGVDDEEEDGCATLIIAKHATTAVVVDNISVGAQAIGAVTKDAETIAATCPRAPGSTPRSTSALNMMLSLLP